MAYKTKVSTIRIDRLSFFIEHLLDRAQVGELQDEDLRAGVHENNWPYFGQIWPSGLDLAELLMHAPVDGKILEVGCGLALPSLVLKTLGADITAMDHHPEVETFLRRNLHRNGIRSIPFHREGFDEDRSRLGSFDLIVGADLLYEDRTPVILSRFLQNHIKPRGRIVIVDPGRNQTSRFIKEMISLGFSFEDQLTASHLRASNGASTRIFSFQQGESRTKTCGLSQTVSCFPKPGSLATC